MENGFLTQIKINSTLGNELVTVQEAKDYIRVDTSADDNLISALISQARLWCENYISKDIVSFSIFSSLNSMPKPLLI